jgi:hypothetical protein
VPSDDASSAELVTLVSAMEELGRTSGIESPRARKVAQSVLAVLTCECDLAQRGDPAGTVAFAAALAKTLAEVIGVAA